MKRWIAVAALAAVLGTSASAFADFPVTTQSTQSNTGRSRPLFGNGGVLFPWLGGSGSNNRMATSRNRANRGSFGTATSRANARGTRDATGVMPDLGRVLGTRR